MTTRQRAIIADERTPTERYFIIIESEHGSTSSVRFNTMAQAKRIAYAINSAYDAERRLWEGPNDD